MEEHETTHDDEHLEVYGDSGIKSADAKVPRWLKLTYLILPFWGLIVWLIFWNGSNGWLDHGSWGGLQQAANTTFPFINEDIKK